MRALPRALYQLRLEITIDRRLVVPIAGGKQRIVHLVASIRLMLCVPCEDI
jgi:hypothetical protein